MAWDCSGEVYSEPVVLYKKLMIFENSLKVLCFTDCQLADVARAKQGRRQLGKTVQHSAG